MLCETKFEYSKKRAIMTQNFVSDLHGKLMVIVNAFIMSRGYHTAVRRHEFYLQVVKANILRMSLANE